MLVHGELPSEVARSYQVTPSFVSRLLGQARRNKAFFEELMARRDSKQQQRTLIGEKIQELNKETGVIDSIPTIS